MSPRIEITLSEPFTPNNLAEFLSDLRNNGIPNHDDLMVVHTITPGYDDRFIVDGQPFPNIRTQLRAVSE